MASDEQRKQAYMQGLRISLQARDDRIQKLIDEKVRLESKVDYWLKQYQAEANENTAIRKVLGISSEDPDETLTADAVKSIIGKASNREQERYRAAITLLRKARSGLFTLVEIGSEEWVLWDAKVRALLAGKIGEAK